jgi:hypothetical protein
MANSGITSAASGVVTAIPPLTSKFEADKFDKGVENIVSKIADDSDDFGFTGGDSIAISSAIA